MPRNKYGEVAEAAINPLGVIGRMNLGQLVFMLLSFTSDQRVRYMKTLKGLDEKAGYYFEYINMIDRLQYESELEFFNNLSLEDQISYIKEIEDTGIILHQPPFFNNIDFKGLEVLMRKYQDEAYTMYIGEGDEEVEIDTPLIMADLYMISLKHQPATKFSARSTGQLSIKNVPTKGKEHKDNTQPYSTSAVRMGNMELTNLSIASPEDVKELYESYSTSVGMRNNVIKKILINNYDLYELEGKSTSEVITIIEVLFRCIGLSIITDEDEIDDTELLNEMVKQSLDKE